MAVRLVGELARQHGFGGDLAAPPPDGRGRRAVLFAAIARAASSIRRTVILVDDGVATGATVEAAVRVVRGMGAGRVIVAAPVAPADVVASLRLIAAEVVCPLMPHRFIAVGH